MTIHLTADTVDPDELIAALETAGWTRIGRKPGVYARLSWPPAWKKTTTLLVPLDPDAPDFTDLMNAVLAELALAVDRGRLAELALAEVAKNYCGAVYEPPDGRPTPPPCGKKPGHEHGPDTDWKRNMHSNGTLK